MSEETLLTAARRLVRFITINESCDGGLVTQQTLLARDTLQKEIAREEKRLKAENEKPHG